MAMVSEPQNSFVASAFGKRTKLSAAEAVMGL